MKRIILVSILFFTIILTTSAQKVDFSVSQKVKGRIHYTEIIGSYEGSFYVVRFDKKSSQTFIIERYNKSLKIVDQYEFKVEKEINVDKIVQVGDRILIFKSKFNKKEKTYVLFCDILNEKLNLVKRERFVAATKIKPSNKKIFKISKDIYTSNVLIFYPKEIANSVVYFNILVLTNNLLQVYDRNINIAPEKDFIFDELHLTGNSVAIVFTARLGEKLRTKRDHYSLLYYNLDKNEKRIIDLYNDTMRYHNYLFKYDRLNESYIIAGLYAKNGEDELQGLAYGVINKESNKGDFKYLSFSKDIVQHIMGRSKSYIGIKDYMPKDIVIRSDGGIILVTEYFDIQKELYSDYYNINHSYVKYFYKYSDVVIYSLQKSGELDWYKILRKDQVTMNDEGYYSSFLTGISKDKLLIVYNDISRSKWNIISDKVNPDGEVKNRILVKDTDFDGYMIPKIGKQISPNEFVIPGFGRKKGFVVMKVTL